MKHTFNYYMWTSFVDSLCSSSSKSLYVLRFYHPVRHRVFPIVINIDKSNEALVLSFLKRKAPSCGISSKSVSLILM